MQITAAVVRTAEQPFQIETLEIDSPRAGEVLVEIESVGLCHTDIGVQKQWLPVPLPLVLGHEGAGRVVEVGDGVTSVATGDPVLLTFASCRRCRSCLDGHPAYCESFPALNVLGTRLDGTTALTDADGEPVNGQFFSQSSFATHAIALESNVIKLSADADLRQVGPLGCGIQTGAGTVLNGLRPPAGSSIAVYGVGAVGLAAIMAARVAGCTKIVAVDRIQSRLDAALEFGATDAVNSETDDIVESIRAITGVGTDYAVDTTAVTTVVRQGVSVLAPRGTLAILGFGKAGTDIEIDMLEFLMAGRTIVGMTEGDAVPSDFIPRLIELNAQGRFPYDKLITHYPFADINQACADVESGVAVKAVLDLK